MTTWTNSLYPVLLAGLFWLPGATAAELYRWVDDQGRVHYSDQKNSDKADTYTPQTELSTFSNVYFLQQPKPDTRGLPPFDQRRNSPDLESLLAVKFPQAPNVGNVTAYIQRIYHISRLQKQHLGSDPQVTMLLQVGDKFLHLLIRETNSHVGWHNYGIEAIKQLAKERHKAQIVDAMKRYSKYASVLYAKGWHHEFQQRLIDGLRNNRGYLPSDWIRAVAEFERDDAREVLIEYFKYGWNGHITYKYIAALEGIEDSLASAIPIAWENTGNTNKYARGELTPRALEQGYKPAFRYLMSELKQNGARAKYSMDAYSLAQRFTGQSGSPEEILNWYRNNQPEIKFDPARSIFTTR